MLPPSTGAFEVFTSTACLFRSRSLLLSTREGHGPRLLFHLDAIDHKTDQLIPADKDQQFYELDWGRVGGKLLPERIRGGRCLV